MGREFRRTFRGKMKAAAAAAAVLAAVLAGTAMAEDADTVDGTVVGEVSTASQADSSFGVVEDSGSGDSSVIQEGSSDDEISDDGSSDGDVVSDGDSSEETEFIPDEYYEPVQSNAVGGWPQGEAIQASAGVVMDMDTGTLLYSKNAQRQLYPASITKIMTCLVTLENASLDDTFTCTDAVYDLDENASNIALQEGETISVKDALYALMMESANDAANALAVHVGGSVSSFADMMNQKAESLGCTGTHFANPSGLHNDNHYTCARDMALIASAAYENETFRTLIGTTEYEMKPTDKTEESRYFSNHHRMIHQDSDSYQSWCTGGKTGFTEKAWNTLVTYGEKDGMRLVCVLLKGNGADRNYQETADLMNYGFGSFTHLTVGGEDPDRTLGSALKASYPGVGGRLSAPELSQKIMTVSGSDVVTVPSGTDASSVERTPFAGEDGTNSLAASYGAPLGQSADNGATAGSLYYTFGGWPVGSMGVAVSPVSFSLSVPWQVETVVSVREEAQTVSGGKSQSEAWEDIGRYVQSAEQKRQAFVSSNKETIILIICCVLIVVLLIVLILILRSTKQYRMKKKMKKAEEEARRISEEIEARTTEEIEQELREAMRREQENQDELGGADQR